MNHPAMQQLLDYVDGYREDTTELHLRTCADCQATLRSVKAVDHAIHQFPLEEPSTAFTERLLRQLGIRKSASLGWIIARNLAPLFALSLIVVVLFVVFNGTGMLAGSDVGDSFTAVINVKLSVGVSASNLWMEKILPFAFAKQYYGFTTLVIIILGIVAMLDRFVFVPMWRKRT